MDLAVTVALGWPHPRSSPQSSCFVCLVVKYSLSAASAPVMPVTPSAHHAIRYQMTLDGLYMLALPTHAA